MLHISLHVILPCLLRSPFPLSLSLSLSHAPGPFLRQFHRLLDTATASPTVSQAHAAHRLLCPRPHAAAIGPRPAGCLMPAEAVSYFNRVHLPAIRPVEQSTRISGR
ncbi:hypothetical protein V8C34DRAFT_267505 [Trichoderma compactum]